MIRRLHGQFTELRALRLQGTFMSLLQADVFYELLLTFLLVVSAILIPLLSFDYGVTWDERMSMEYCADVINYFKTFGEDKTCLDITKPVYNHLIYYGNIFGLISSLLAYISPFDVIGTRHLLNSLLGFLTIFYTVRLARDTAGIRAAVLAFFFLFFMPRFFGHIMNDFRDTAFMFGYVAAIYYMTKLLRELPVVNIKTALKVALAIFFTAGVRIGGIGLLGILLLTMFVHLLSSPEKGQFSRLFWRYAGLFTGIAVLAYTLTVLIWPWGHQDPLRNPFSALQTFSDLQLIVSYQLFNGEMLLNQDVPWQYLFVWIGITTPVVVLLGFFLNLIWESMKLRNFNLSLAKLTIYLALIVPLVSYLYGVKNLYDSWRHFLFLSPYIILLSVFGWKSFLQALKSQRLKIAGIGIMLALLLLPIRSVIANHPFQTLYFNELIGGIAGAYGKFELDIDGNAVRYGMEWLNKYTKEKNINQVLLGTNNDPLSISHFSRDSLFRGNIVWLGNGGTMQTDWDYAVITTRTLSSHQILSGQWPFKESIHTIEVEGVPVVSILERIDKNIVKGIDDIREGRNADAVEHLRKAVAFNPNHEEPNRLLAMAMINVGFYDEADSLLIRTLELNPGSTFAYYYRARICYLKKDFDGAEIFLERSLHFRESNPAAEQLMANIMMSRGELDAAEAKLLSLIEMTNITVGDMAGIRNDLANVYIMKAKKSSVNRLLYLNKAIDHLGKAIVMNPDLYVAYQNLYLIYHDMGAEENAQKVAAYLNDRLRKTGKIK